MRNCGVAKGDLKVGRGQAGVWEREGWGKGGWGGS